MTDVLTREQRSRNMASIRSRDTKPELKVRSLLDGMGRRYQLFGAGLPGKPDIVFPDRRRAIFVNGCFWHMHGCRYGRVRPKTNPKFWREKRTANAQRDRKNIKALRKAGWKVLTVWGCQIRNEKALRKVLRNFI